MTERKSKLNKGLFSSTTDQWATPQAFFDKLNEEFHFTLDPCATAANAKCSKYYTEADDGLQQDWQGEVVFCNPPYGREIAKWVKKSYDEGKKDNTTVVMLIPARTDTSYFHDYIYHKAEIRFIRGRLHFNEAPQGAPFPSMVVVFGNLLHSVHNVLICYIVDRTGLDIVYEGLYLIEPTCYHRLDIDVSLTLSRGIELGYHSA